MADGVVTVLRAVERPRREAGTPAQEAVALKDALAQSLAEIEALAEGATGDASDMLAFQAAMLVRRRTVPAGVRSRLGRRVCVRSVGGRNDRRNRRLSRR